MLSDDSETEILPVSNETPVYKVSRYRFYVLFVFSFLSFNQTIIWLTFSPIARSTETYYNITESTVDLLLNWGPIIFIPCLPIATIILNQADGLRYCVVLLAVMEFFAALSRILPMIIFTPSPNSNFNSMALPFIHIGQILNAACGPLVMAPVSQLSCIWFAPHERTRATTVAIIACNFGSMIGFVISPFIVSLPEHVPRLLYIHFGFAFVSCVLTLIYFPARPPTAPSSAAELFIQNSRNNQVRHSLKLFLRNVWTCLKSPPFLLLSTAGGLLYGTYGSWTSLYDVILEPENYTEIETGWFGFGASATGIAGALCFSYIADKPCFQHSLKILILVSLFICLLAIVWFYLSVRSIFYDKHILPSTVITIGLSTGLSGFFAGAVSPLIYEALAEIMYPLPESISASILVQFINVVALAFLFAAPNREKLVNFIMLVTMIICLTMVLLTKFSYKRRDEDERRRLQRQQIQTINDNSINQSEERQYGTFVQ